jgi:ankyrin repeat protein
MTALMLATVEGQAEAARTIIDVSGAKLDLADASGNQALHLAALRGDLDLTRLLLLAGAATEARNHEGMTALSVASSVRHDDEVAGVGHAAVVRLLLAGRADIEAGDSKGATPLMIAAAAGNAPLVKLLLQKGAKVDAVDTTGLSALELAMRGAHDECETVLRNALEATAGTGAFKGLKDET